LKLLGQQPERPKRRSPLLLQLEEVAGRLQNHLLPLLRLLLLRLLESPSWLLLFLFSLLRLLLLPLRLRLFQRPSKPRSGMPPEHLPPSFKILWA
jgi:hypothetical protein